MKIKKTISFANIKDPVLKGIEQTRNISPIERISILEELRFDLGRLTGYDYSRRFKRLISFIKR